MNTLKPEKQKQVLAALVEGNSIRATCRITGTAKGTVLKLLEDVGKACAEYQDKDLFPHVSLTAAAGYQGQGLGVTPDITTFIWSVGPSASWPLLDFGTLDALVDMVDLRSRELLASYKQTVLNAVREVDSSINTYVGQQDRLRNLTEALTASHRAVSLATQRYDRGLTDALNVIDAERQEYELEQQYVLTQTTAAEQFIALYKALGGGWEQYQSFPPIRQPQPAVLAAFERLLSSDNSRK